MLILNRVELLVQQDPLASRYIIPTENLAESSVICDLNA